MAARSRPAATGLGLIPDPDAVRAVWTDAVAAPGTVVDGVQLSDALIRTRKRWRLGHRPRWEPGAPRLEFRVVGPVRR